MFKKLPCTVACTPSRSTRTSRNARAIQEEEEDLQRAMAESLMSLSQSNPRAREVLREEDNEGIEEETTSKFLEKLLQQGQWRVVFINESWQLAKRLLIPEHKQPPRHRKHPTMHSYVVPRNVMPSKVTKIKADGACLFRALSFAIFRSEDCHRAVREEILKHMQAIWDTNDRVRLHAAMFYQQKTGLQQGIPPSLVRLTAQHYIESTRMDVPSIWGGSTELEVAGG